MRTLPLILAAAAVTLAACTAPAATAPVVTAPTDGVAAVKAANDVYEKALLDGDAAALDRVLADDFGFTGWQGETSDKAGFIADATRGHDMTVSKPRDVVIRQLASTVVTVTGIWEGDTVTDGRTEHAVERFSNVWVHSSAGWRMVSEHTSPLVAAP